MDYDYKLFVPYDNLENKCAILVNNDYYYVYDLYENELSDEYDVVLFNNYFKMKGTEINDYVVTDCYPYITNDFYYRNDLDSILTSVLIISIFGFLLSYYILTHFFKRFR